MRCRGVGNGWEFVSKYIETQDVHQVKNGVCGLSTFVGGYFGLQLLL